MGQDRSISHLSFNLFLFGGNALLIQMIGNYPDPSFPPNAVIDWDETEAKRMIELGMVREWPIVPPPKQEPAAAPAPTRKTKKG